MQHNWFALVILAILYSLGAALQRYDEIKSSDEIIEETKERRVSARIQGFFVPAINDAFGGAPRAPAEWAIAKVKEFWSKPWYAAEVLAPRKELSASAVVVGKDGMPLYGIASTTSFWDSDMTACGKQPRGKIPTREGDRNNFRAHGPLAAINHRWYKTHYANDPPHNKLSHDFYSKSIRALEGFCNEHCYELTAIQTAYGRRDRMPSAPIVVKIGDECTDVGWCDATEFSPSGHTSGITKHAKNTWPIAVPTHVHFDVMAGSLQPDHPWYGYSLNVPNADTNFLVRFRRVACTSNNAKKDLS
jgi:hypothetical protein